MSNEGTNEQHQPGIFSPTETSGYSNSSNVNDINEKRASPLIISRFRTFQQRTIARLPLPLQEIIAQLDHRVLAYTTAALLFTSFLLLLLVALSSPIIKSIYIFKLVAVPEAASPEPPTIIADQISFGVYGYCLVSEINVLPGTTLPQCSSPQIGYTLSPSLIDITGEPQIINAVLEALFAILVLHPISAALSFVAMVPAFFLGHHVFEVTALVMAIVTAVFTSISCAIDIGIVAVAINEVPNLTEFSFKILWGPAPWMTFAAVILTWIAVIILSAVVCRCCGLSRGEKKTSLDQDVI